MIPRIHNVQDVVLCNERDEHLWYQFKAMYMLGNEQIVVLHKGDFNYGFEIMEQDKSSYLQQLSYHRISILKKKYPTVFHDLQESTITHTAPLRLIAFTYNEFKTKSNYRICISFASDEYPLDAYSFFLQTGADYVHFLKEPKPPDEQNDD
ncbi:arylsulfatase regulator [Paenibacillus profundus]|uniref:Arylsulfatase regulator n=1 Tax=Paenibacillus profundus TaxID=1173085 RepID=A0ABS8YJV0_9BACL|nr:arylsulfatase regulator [Paenibacillus profundus]MCE5170601.1 arylsulfatase regulator [Paenibacillus profundus]